MRAGQLSNPAFVDLLRPFIVTSWHGAGVKEMPDDVKTIFTTSAIDKQSNVFMFALDAAGQLVHGFNTVRGGPRGRAGSGPQQEIERAIDKLMLSDTPADTLEPHPLVLPDLPATKTGLPAGVRLFVRPGGLSGGRGSVIELVSMQPDQWKLLERPDQHKEIKAESLRSWLVQMYPPAIRTADQMKPFTSISGTLALEPAGSDGRGRYALLRGEVRLAKGDETKSAFEGRLHAVLTYGPDSESVKSLQGTIEGDYLYRIRGTQVMPLIAAIESRPAELVGQNGGAGGGTEPAVFDSMVNAVEYAQKRLGGGITLRPNGPFDRNAERTKVAEIVEKLNESGFVPGEPSTCRVF